MSQSKRAKKARYLIAIDGPFFYLRRTLCVNHDHIAGEIRYDAKHTTKGRVPRHIRKAFAAAYQAVNGTKP